jgi:hypothetical protein
MDWWEQFGRREIPPRPKRTLWVELPWATFGLVCRNGHVIEAGPPARYAIGWTVDEAIAYFGSRGASMEWGTP